MSKIVYYQHNPIQSNPINEFGNFTNPFTDRRLEIEDLKTCRKATVFRNNSPKHWVVESTSKFKYKDRDYDDYRIREYYGFFGNVTKYIK